MAEMKVTTPEIKRLVEDYDIIFVSGQVMPITIDPSVGDTFATFPSSEIIKIHLSPKPSPSDKNKTLPAEDITVYLKHVISVQRREREVVELTPEQRAEWERAMKQILN